LEVIQSVLPAIENNNNRAVELHCFQSAPPPRRKRRFLIPKPPSRCVYQLSNRITRSDIQSLDLKRREAEEKKVEAALIITIFIKNAANRPCERKEGEYEQQTSFGVAHLNDFDVYL